MATPIESRTVIIDGADAHLKTLSIIYCSSCRRVLVAGWPDWKIEKGVLVGGGTLPVQWEMQWRNCRSCESKSHLEEAYELDPIPLLEKWIADIGIGHGDTRQSDEECTKHVSWYKDQRFTFLTLDEDRGLQPILEEDFGYDFDIYLNRGGKEVCVTVVESFCAVSSKAWFDCEHCRELRLQGKF